MERSMLSSLVFRFGRLYLCACENNLSQAAVLYTLGCHGKPEAWLPIFAPTMPFLETHEVLMSELSVRQIHTALKGLREKALIHQAHYIGRSATGDPGTVVTDEGVDIETLPSSTRLIMSRHPLPTYFVQVDYVAILTRVHPDIDVLVATAIETAQRIYASPQHDAKLLSLALAEVCLLLTKQGEEPFYISPPFRTILTAMLVRQIATV